MNRARRAMLIGLLALAGACKTTLHALPLQLPAASSDAYARSLSLRQRAQRESGDEAKATCAAALQAAREALEASPDEFRFALLIQDLEFELDATAARERYAGMAQTTAWEKTLAARALLPEKAADARVLLVAACKQEADFAWAHYGLASVARKQGDGSIALAEAEAALALDPRMTEALRTIADLQEEQGARLEAVAARKLLIEVTHGDLEERQHYAQLLLDADDRSDATAAEKELRVILATLGDPPPAASRDLARDCLLDIGTAFARRFKPDEAMKWWRRALELDPECLTALYNVGVTEQACDRPQEALAAFTSYLEVAQTMTRPLPATEVYARHFYVPQQIEQLRRKLGLDPAPPVEERPVSPEAGR